MKTVIKSRKVDLDKLIGNLTVEEMKRVEELQSVEASHCKGMSCGTLTMCAVLCEGMSCSDFKHSCAINVGCLTNIKCRGFTGDGGGCGPFEQLPAGPAG